MENKYQFRALTKEEEMRVSIIGDRCCFIGNSPKIDGLYFARIYGSIRALFGEPIFQNIPDGILYSYCIEAKNAEDNVIYLEVYHGPTGPRIKGYLGDEGIQAANGLSELIAGTKPADYELSFFNLDGPSEVEFGVKNGRPYWNETEVRLWQA